jgi:hypothetical protein
VKIELIESPSEAEIAIIYEGLRTFNIPNLPELKIQRYFIVNKPIFNQHQIRR